MSKDTSLSGLRMRVISAAEDLMDAIENQPRVDTLMGFLDDIDDPDLIAIITEGVFDYDYALAAIRGIAYPNLEITSILESDTPQSALEWAHTEGNILDRERIVDELDFAREELIRSSSHLDRDHPFRSRTLSDLYNHHVRLCDAAYVLGGVQESLKNKIVNRGD